MLLGSAQIRASHRNVQLDTLLDCSCEGHALFPKASATAVHEHGLQLALDALMVLADAAISIELGHDETGALPVEVLCRDAS